ncbi:hypothetical protein C1637_11460 [Chryseobacterium lactis]|uniref:YcxB family protein n=1 Tax=Chryseobacterium lactis TaxID=1241981 RepID=A0A3G6RVE0_CHRLC|nr:hypothetical protein [Chryseobacterium lactis]AZA80844.1 hypothetical protein EG342_02480 [Chryseobacterium lactis]AZB05846.1 hypothetical protein EG341_18605 [Chryseobacterium lactis]PNW13434.1 hypothetical protein C1637_11460 [Chryseobacterium lactis]
MKQYKLKNFSVKRLMLYMSISFLLVMLFTILTSIYYNPKIYPAIVLFILTSISFILIKNNCINTYNISLDNNYIYFNSRKIDLIDICNYNFSETEQFYGCRLVFKSYKIFLNIPKKESGDYLDFKEDFMDIIKFQNKNRSNNLIVEYSWYNTKFAQIYGYVMIGIMIIWFMLMILFPNKLNISNLGLFLMVSVGLSPIIYRIFKK